MNNLDNYDNYDNYDNLLPEANQSYNNMIMDQPNQEPYRKSILKANSNNRNMMTNAIQRPQKKRISYDDILSSMNTVVIDGKLEFIKKDTLQNIMENQPHQQQQQQQQQQQPYKKKIAFNQPPPVSNPQTSQFNKNSYIYNKYFKDYKDPNYVQYEEPERPLTKKELIKQLIINKINAINERNRIAEIKSTKLFFNNNNNRNIVINSRHIQNPSTMNHLFKFK
jgi:hypothetical protein